MTPTHDGTSYPSMSARESQSLADPSTVAKASTMTPIASVRGSRHAERALSRVSGTGTGGRKARAPSATATSARTPATPTCSDRGASTAAIGTPTAAPAMLPRLQPAWKRGMIVRPIRRSTSAPSTFMATSHTPIPTP